MNKVEYLYRFEDSDVRDYPWNRHKKPQEYLILKRTPCGVWIDLGWRSDKKFVNLKAHKKWACETKAQAYESYAARKRRQIKILQAQVEAAEDLLRIASNKEVFDLDDKAPLLLDLPHKGAPDES